MSSDVLWRVHVKNLATTIRIGIHDHEQHPQRVLVNATVEARYDANPQDINDCFNYDCLHALIVQEWPRRKHTALLETYVTELLNYIFERDPRVERARASVCKPDIFHEAETVGVEAEWTRDNYLRLSGHK